MTASDIKQGSTWVSHDGEVTCMVVFRFEDIVRLDFGGWAENYSVAELLRDFVSADAPRAIATAKVDLN